MKTRAQTAIDFGWKPILALSLSTTFALCVYLFAQSQVLGSTNREIVVDPATGVALYGFDPVAYFVDGKALQGDDAFERRWSGASWRFLNRGNMQAFFDAPAIYCPRYGGDGALSVSRGLTTAGKPVFFEIYDGKLYFFYSHANRLIWLNNPKIYIAEANKKWQNVKSTLSK